MAIESGLLVARTLRALAFAGALGTVACGDAPDPDAATAAPTPAEPTATARPGNADPQIGSLRLEPDEPRSGDTVTAHITVDDPDGDRVSIDIAWEVDGESARGRSETFRIPARHRGKSVAVRVTARDGRGGKAAAETSVEVANHPPAITDVRFVPAVPTVEAPIRVQPRAEDPDGDVLDYRVTWWVDGNESPTRGEALAPREFQRGNEIVAEVVAYDGEIAGPAQRSEPVIVGNAAPRLTSSPDALQGEQTLRQTLRAEDPDGDRRLRFELMSGPAGLVIDAVTGELVWTPTPEQSGRHAVEIEIHDGHGGETTERFELSVGASPASAL